jgi:D-3-phosphoglycerate dehydrogenase
LGKLKQYLPKNCSIVVPSSSSEDELLRLVDDVDMIVSARVSGKMIKAALKLKMIQTTGAGVDGVDVDAATERGVIVCSSVGLNAVPVAEHAMSLILSLAKNITKYDKRIRSEGWIRFPSVLLRKKTLGIVGFGSIGVEVAKRAKAFEMNILAVKRQPSEELKRKLGLDFLGSQDDLPRILTESDFILLSIVLTPETVKMIGEKELRMMKKSAYLVNISRGNVLDEKALIKALEEGTIAGAGLDVYEAEPIKRDNPLLKLENVILTPHVAGAVEDEEMMRERAEFIARNAEKIVNGQKPEKVVDPNLKYVIDQ